MPTPRRRIFTLETSYGSGTMAGLEMGPEDRPLDVLFLHANGFNANTYSPILGRLAGSYRVLAADLRGHGLTRLPKPASPPGWRIYAEDLVALLGTLGEMPRVLAGHSMGATTALLAAPALPDIAALVLFDPVIVPAPLYARARGADFDLAMAQAALRRNADFASRAAAFAAYRGRGAFRTWPDAFLHAYLQDGLAETPQGGVTLNCAPAWEAANFASYAMDDPTPALHDIAARIRILRAEHGSTCALEQPPPAAADMMIETVPGTSHFLPMEQPDAVMECLTRALA